MSSRRSDEWLGDALFWRGLLRVAYREIIWYNFDIDRYEAAEETVWKK